MYKNSKYLTLILLICFSISINTFADTISPEKDIIDRSKIEYDEISSKISSIDSEIAKLDIEIETLTLSLANNNEKISSIELEIGNTEKILEQTKIDIENLQKQLDKRVRTIFKSNLNSNLFVFILSSDNFSDFFSRIDSASRIISFDKKLMDNIEAKESSLKQSMDKLNSDKESILNLKKQIENSLKEIENKKSIQQDLLAELNKEKENIFDIIEANEKKLVEHPISVINSSSSSLSQISNAILTLQSLIPQLNSDYVITLAKDAISIGNTIIEEANTPPPPSNNDSTGEGIATYSMDSTAYTGGDLTAMGLKPVRDPNGISTVAVDPNVIPLGSKVYVSGYGVAIASDTGGAIKGNKIDVYLNSFQECISWGRRNVTVTLLAYPGEW